MEDVLEGIYGNGYDGVLSGMSAETEGIFAARTVLFDSVDLVDDVCIPLSVGLANASSSAEGETDCLTVESDPGDIDCLFSRLSDTSTASDAGEAVSSVFGGCFSPFLGTPRAVALPALLLDTMRGLCC